MRVALVVPGGVDASGERRVVPAVVAYVRRLARLHEVEVVALLQEPVPRTWELAGARVHNIGRPRTGWRALRTVLALHRTRRFDIVHAFWCGTSGLVASLAGRLCRIPSIIHLGGGELAAIPDIGYGAALRWRGRLREPWVLRSASQVTAASAPVIESLAVHGIAARRIPLGVDLDAWPALEPRARDGSAPLRVIHVASLNPVKDQSTLLRALHLLQGKGVSFTLDVIGEDTLHGRIQAQAQELGLAAAARFHGFLTQREMRPLFERADVLLHSSRHETGPLVVLEAAIAGIPTVGTAVGHIAEWAPAAALAASPRDAAGLAAHLARLAADDAMRLQIARAAQQRALAEDADATARSFISLYHALHGERRRSSSTR